MTSVESSAPLMDDTTTTTSTTTPSVKHNKVCDFYLTRGCTKGDECDYIHPKAPDGSITNKLCEFYLHPRGCVKGDECNFLHIPPQLLTGKYKELHPLGAVNSLQPKIQKICEFYMTPEGCKKATNCEYLHPGYQQPVVGVRGGVCLFFNSPGGCKKGASCDRLHAAAFSPFPPSFSPYAAPVYAASLPFSTPPPPPSSKTHPTRPIPCPYYSSAAGCKKMDDCDYLHVKPIECQFFSKYGNCKKGEWCDHLHSAAAAVKVGGGGIGAVSGYGGVRRGVRTARYNPY